jgi:hypothetical protein
MSTAELLKAARAKIEKPENWTKGTNARDANGNPTAAYSPAAVCFCAIGAIHSITMPRTLPNLDARTAMVRALMHFHPNCFVSDFNDAPTTTHANVLALFDEAIANEEAAA